MSSAAGAGEPTHSSRHGEEREDCGSGSNRKEDKEVDVPEGDVDLDLYGAAAGWVEARTSCPHLPAMPAASADELARVPAPDSQCSRFVPSSSSNFVSRSWACHANSQHHVPFCSDLSVWCFACDSYLDAQSILELRPVYEVAHLLKFGERPPFRSLEVLDLSSGQNGGSSSSS
ncbi:hypothetical protein ACQ4PT_020677 [Festuca glaucescens]